MKTLALVALTLLAAPAAHSELIAVPGANPTVLAEQIRQGRWPAEIVKAADECLARFPDSACSAEALAARPAAAHAASALRARNVNLYRSAVLDSRLGTDMQADLHAAALGDGHAAERIGQLYGHGADASVTERHRFVAWMSYAAQLGDERASYELALVFRTSGEPAIAAMWEARATQLGFVPPLALDHIRK